MAVGGNVKKIFIIVGIVIAVLAFGIIFAKITFTGNSIREEDSAITLKVAIPCSGHASLIINELKKLQGVSNVEFRSPNYFDVRYDSTKVSKQEILSLNIFKQYKATETK